MRALPVLALLLAAAQAQPDMVVEATTDRAVYATGEPIVFRYTLRNQGDAPYETSTSSSCPTGVTLEAVTLPVACTADDVPFVIEPGRTVHYEWTLVPEDLGVPEGDGPHTVWGYVGSWGPMDPAGAELAASATFKAPPYLGGPLEVVFDEAEAEAVADLRADVGGTVVSTRAYPSIGVIAEEWQIAGVRLSEAIETLTESGSVRGADRAPRYVAPRVTSTAEGPLGARLSAPTPNPADGSATLTLRLSAPADVTVDVVDALGRRVAVVREGPLAGGADHAVAVETGALAAGVYTVRVAGPGVRAARRLTVAR